MKKAEVQIGATYVAKVSGRLQNVRLVKESIYGGWDAINERTKRSVRIRTAAKLRQGVPRDRIAAIKGLRSAGATFEQARASVDRTEQEIRDAAADLRADGGKVTPAPDAITPYGAIDFKTARNWNDE